MSVKLILIGVQSRLNSLHVDAHRSMIVALVVIVAVAGLAAPRYGRSQQTPEMKLKKDLRSKASYSSWARSEIATGPGIRLKRTTFEKNYGGTAYSFIIQCPNRSAIPDEVSANSSNTFCYGSFHPPSGLLEVDTGFFFYYEILVPKGTEWVPSGYYMDAATKVPLFGGDGARRLECTIKKSGSTNPAVGAPFQCATSWTGSGNDSEPHWKVTGNPVEEIDASNSANATRAAQLIADNCKEVDTLRCRWNRTKNSVAFLPDRAKWRQVTDYADSCPPTKNAVLTLTKSVQISWSDKVGGKIAAKLTGHLVAATVEASVEANYEHSITQTDTWSQTYTYPIPNGYRSALYLQHGMLEVTGDFAITTDKGQRYQINNAVFLFPLSDEVRMEDRGQSIPQGVIQHVDLPCSVAAPPQGAPPPRGPKVITGTVTKKTP